MCKKAIPSLAKKQLILLFFIILNFSAYGQYKNNLSLVYGLGTNGIIKTNFTNQPFNMVGINYTRKVNTYFCIETGIEYYNNNQKYIEPLTLYNNTPYFNQQSSSNTNKGNVKTISVPIYANFVFLKYLYADIGVYANFEDYHLPVGNSIKQNIGGIAGGIGGKYAFNKIIVFVNPFFRSDIADSPIVNLGVKFGVGYGF